MNFAVDNNAEENKRFAYYVDWLDDNGYVPPTGKPWVKYIKDIGNEANHEINQVELSKARNVMRFTEALLKLNVEIPSLLPKPDSSGSA